MLPKYLKVKNFTSYLDETINFESFPSIFGVIGENGAGKSSIIDMITTAIFYRARGTDNRGSGMDELITSGTNGFEIEFAFTMNNSDYKIIRRKYRDGGHELEFYVNDKSQTEKITETQEKINNIIKMDYDTFLDTVCIGQGQSGRFMKKKPNERKDVFVQVLGLDKYETLEKYVKELKKGVADDVEKIENKVNAYNQIVELKDKYLTDQEDAEEEIEEIKISITSKEEELETILKVKAQYEQMKKQRDHILSQRKSLKSKIETTSTTIDKANLEKENLEKKVLSKNPLEELMEKTRVEAQDLQDNYNTLTNKKSSLEATNSMLSNQAKELKVKYDKLKNYNEAICNFCGNDITDVHKESHLKELMNEGKKFLSEVSKNKDEITKLGEKINEINITLSQTKKSLLTYQSNYNSVLQADTQLGSVLKRINELEQNLVDYKNEYDQNLLIAVDDLEECSFNDTLLKVEINQLRQKLTSLQSIVAIAKNKLSDIADAEIAIKQLENKLNELKVLHDDYESLAVAYGKSGIQADIIGNALPEIEDEINKLLELLCHGSVNVEFRTQKEKKMTKKSKAKSAASIETLDIIINDETGSRTYETYSGGEQFRVDFACHVGLAKFLAKRAGATIDFFIVDEGLGSQDENARSQFTSSVMKLTSIFKKVMVITHIEELKEAFGNRVLVTKDPVEGSKVKLL